LALSPTAELVVLAPSDAAYSEVARYKVADGGTYAYPVPAGNGNYIKDQETLTLWTVE
jgi:outer membrane protein assembly factor BamB